MRDSTRLDGDRRDGRERAQSVRRSLSIGDPSRRPPSSSETVREASVRLVVSSSSSSRKDGKG